MESFVINLIHGLGYFGIFITMALESACIPVPSEVIMPFGGFLALSGHLRFWGVVIAGTGGNVAGSLLAYFVGRYGGQKAVLTYGGRVGISRHHVLAAENWFAKRGEVTVLVSRILPIVRTFISLPAGICRMPIWKFAMYTAVGSLPWAYTLTLAGFQLGKHWGTTTHYMKPMTYIVGFLLVAVLALLVLKRRNTTSAKQSISEE